MPLFRKKPIVLEAKQFLPPPHPDPTGVYRDATDGKRAYVVTAHNQKVYVLWGDWIIPEPIDPDAAPLPIRCYPVKDEIFRATYEEVDPTALTSTWTAP